MSYNKSEKSGWNYDKREGRYCKEERDRRGTKYVCDCPEKLGQPKVSQPEPQQTPPHTQQQTLQQPAASQQKENGISFSKVIFFIIILIGLIRSCT